MASLVEQIQAARGAPAGGSLVQQIQAARAAEPQPEQSRYDAILAQGREQLEQRGENGLQQMRAIVDPRITGQIAQGITLGGADEVIGGLAGLVTGRGYQAGVDTAREQNAAFAEENPSISAGAQIGGALMAGAPVANLLKAAPTLLGRVAQGVGLGAGSGAAAGFLSGEGGAENRAEGALTGAAIGGILGGGIPATGALIRRGADAFKTLFRTRPADEQANRLIAGAMRRDSLDPAAATQKMGAAGGQPMAPADLGPNLQRLLGSAYRAPGQGRTVISEILDARGALRPQRLTEIVKRSFGAPEDFYGTIDSLRAAQSAKAKPLYDALRQTDPASLNTPEMIEILNTPAGRSAITAAEQRAKNLREPFPQLVESVTDPATGETSLQVTKIPNFEALDQVKRSLDNIIEDSRDPISGRISSEVRDLASVRGDLVSEMDRVTNKAYAEARGVYAGPAQSQDALWLGRDLARGGADLEPLLRQFNKLSDADKDMARLGVARQLAEMVSRGSETRNQALGFLSPQMRGRLEAIFPNRASYEALEDAVRRESQMVGTDRTVRSGSQTAERLNEDANQVANLGEIAQIGEAVASGSPMRIARAGLGAAARRAQGMDENVAKEVGRRLLANDPASRAQVMDELQRLMFTPKKRGPITGLLSAESRTALPGLLGSYTAPTSNR